MIKSKNMTVAAAALAMCMAGSAFAQDRHFDRGQDRDAQQGQRYRADDRRGGPDRFRDHQDYREGRQADRRGFPVPRDEWRRGGRVPPEFRGRNYVVEDWRGHHLSPPPRGYQWVGVGGDFVLIAVASGIIAQIIAGQ